MQWSCIDTLKMNKPLLVLRSNSNAKSQLFGSESSDLTNDNHMLMATPYHVKLVRKCAKWYCCTTIKQNRTDQDKLTLLSKQKVQFYKWYPDSYKQARVSARFVSANGGFKDQEISELCTNEETINWSNYMQTFHPPVEDNMAPHLEFTIDLAVFANAVQYCKETLQANTNTLDSVFIGNINAYSHNMLNWLELFICSDTTNTLGKDCKTQISFLEMPHWQIPQTVDSLHNKDVSLFTATHNKYNFAYYIPLAFVDVMLNWIDLLDLNDELVPYQGMLMLKVAITHNATLKFEVANSAQPGYLCEPLLFGSTKSNNYRIILN